MRMSRPRGIASVGLVIAAVGVAGGPARADTSRIHDIPRTDKIVIDGKADDWGEAGLRVDLLIPPTGRPKRVADHDARVRLAWDDRGLLVLAVVRDDKWIEHKDEGWLWRYDGIELFLAPRPGAKNRCQWVISPGMTSKQKKLRWKLHDHRVAKDIKRQPAKLTAARTKTPAGYVLEALLPWSALAIEPKAGRQVGVQVYVNDADKIDGETSHAVWYPADNTGFDGDAMYRVRLAARAGPSHSLASWSRYDWTARKRRISVVAPAEYSGKKVTVSRDGRRVAAGVLAKDESGRAAARVTVPEAPATGLAADYAVHLAGAVASTPRVEGAKDFRDFKSVTDLVQRWLLARMYVGHDEIDRAYVGAIEAALHDVEGRRDPGDLRDFLRWCGASKARALWPYRVELRPSPGGLSVSVNRWLSSWTGSTGYSEAPLLDDAKPSSGQIVLDVQQRGGPAGPGVVRDKVLKFQCVRAKTAVNPRWYERASADLTSILTTKLTPGKLYTVRAVASLADGRRIGRAEAIVDHQLKPVAPRRTKPATPSAARPKPLRPLVELEQDVYSYEWADNGATPMWCHGGTSIVRLGDNVFASGIETLPDVAPPWNVRWMLFKGTGKQFKKVADGGDSREREPCPMVCLPADGSVLLSVNPSETEPGNPPDTQVLRFSAGGKPAEYRKPAVLIPKWAKPYKAAAHTYRSIAADGPNREMVLFYQDYRTIDGWKETLWSFYSNRRWTAKGVLKFPQVRVTYPAIQLRNRAVYQLGATDPVPGGSQRDFQQLFYTWCDDITTGKFHPWVEIANRERTGGFVWAADLYVSPDSRDKRVHVLWYDRFLKPNRAFRKKFTPGEKQRISLNYSVIRRGKVAATRAIAESHEGGKGSTPSRAGRFHITPDGRMLVFYHVTTPASENRLIEIFPDGSLGEPVKVPLKTPFHTFFTAGVRAGCQPSWYIDVFGDTRKGGRAGGTMRYARIRLAK